MSSHKPQAKITEQVNPNLTDSAQIIPMDCDESNLQYSNGNNEISSRNITTFTNQQDESAAFVAKINILENKDHIKV